MLVGAGADVMLGERKESSSELLAASSINGADSGVEDERDRLRAELSQRFSEIAYLTKMLDSFKYDSTDRSVRMLVEDLAAYTSELEKSHSALLNSSSWRITAPVRAVIRTLKRAPLPEPFKYRLNQIIGGNN